MATRAAILRSAARCAILLEKALLRLLDNWVRQQAARLDVTQASGPQQGKNRQYRARERNAYDRIVSHANQPAR
jgi:hypothetical protein